MQNELTAICQGLKIVIEMRVERVVLDSRSFEIVNLIRLGDTSTFKIKNILREANQYRVNVLAKMRARGSTKLYLWEDPPITLFLLVC